MELLAPLEGQKSPIDGYLSKIGNTPYHICYEVSGMDECIVKLQDMGFTLLATPAPSVPLGGTVAFLYSPEIGVLECIEYCDRRDT